MAGFERTIEIAAPVDFVFDFTSDFTTLHQWMPANRSIEVLTDGPVAAGTRFRETRLVKGKQRSTDMEIRAHERPDVHAVGGGFGGLDVAFEFRFAPYEQGTRVDLTATVQSGWWMGWARGLVARQIEREDDDILVRLRNRIHDGPPTDEIPTQRAPA